MNKTTQLLGLVVLVAMLALVVAPAAMAQIQASATTDKALAFIKDVLKLDMTKYDASLANYNVAYPNPDKPALETVEYRIQAYDGRTGTIACMLSNGTMLFCSTTESNVTSLTYALSSNTVISATKEILQRYQLLSKDATLTEMVNSLNSVNMVSNVTTTSGNMKLDVTTCPDFTEFWWKHTINGVDYNEIQIVFQNNGLIFSDYHSRTKMGSTDVKISQAQAIATAYEGVNKYSYTAIGGPEGNETKLEISGFNITKERTAATIGPGERDSLLYPCWMVEVYLGNTYPGNIYGFRVDVWADSGQVLSISPLAVGGYDPVTHNDELAQEAGAVSSTIIYIIAAIALTTLSAAVVIVVVKKRRK